MERYVVQFRGAFDWYTGPRRAAVDRFCLDSANDQSAGDSAFIA